MSYEQKAEKFLLQAKKLSSSKGLFGFLFGGSTRTEEAAECYQRAANLYKATKNWTQAGAALYEAANLYLEIGQQYEAASNYGDAAMCYKKVDFNKAINCYLKANDLYADKGRFVMVAKNHQNIAKIYENDMFDTEHAVEHYKQAADYFKYEDNNWSASRCLLKVAQYAAQTENYSKSIIIFEELALLCLHNSLLKSSIKDYLFSACLCHLCVDLLSARHSLDRYLEMFPPFKDSRECKLLQSLIENINEQDHDGFTSAIQKYDCISYLDRWYTTLLLRIKRKMEENVDLR